MKIESFSAGEKDKTMNLIMGWRFGKLFYCENEEEEAGAEEEKIVVKGAPVSGQEKTFTQAELNSFLAEERRKNQKANERTIRQLQELQKSAQLTTEEKERLETRIEDLKNEHLTKEQLAQKEAKKESEKLKKQQDDLIKDRDVWKQRYIDSTMDRALIDAAGPDAYNVSQIVDILKPKTRLAEELDENGQPTGRFVPKVRVPGKDKDGHAVTLDLSATDAVKQMKDMPEYANLFRSGAISGVGGNTTTTVRKSGGPPLDDPAAYRKWRKENMGVRGVSK